MLIFVPQKEWPLAPLAACEKETVSNDAPLHVPPVDYGGRLSNYSKAQCRLYYSGFTQCLQTNGSCISRYPASSSVSFFVLNHV